MRLTVDLERDGVAGGLAEGVGPHALVLHVVVVLGGDKGPVLVGLVRLEDVVPVPFVGGGGVPRQISAVERDLVALSDGCRPRCADDDVGLDI